MPRFFIDAAGSAGDIFLDADETRHAVSVLRLKKGDPVDLFDGRGSRYAGIAGDVENGKLRVRVTGKSAQPFPSPVQITLGAAVFRPERMEMLIQKACELGAHAVVPLLCDRSIVKLSEDRWEAKTERWEKIVRESCKQCGLSFAPEIHKPLPYKNFVKEISRYDLALIPTLEGKTAPLAEALPWPPPRRILALVGPEGDFSPAEVKSALGAGAKPVSLGPLVLRSETAGMYLLSVIHFFYREISRKP